MDAVRSKDAPRHAGGSQAGFMRHVPKGDTTVADEKDLPNSLDMEAEFTILRSSNAPIVYFDVISTKGLYMGICNITTECSIHTGTTSGRAVNRRQVTGHLRFPLAALPALKKAIESIELLAKPAASGTKN